MQSINPAVIGESLDVWLAFDHVDDEEASHEANTYRTATGYRIEWCHSAVGLVSGVDCDTLADAHDWYERNGYQDFSS